MVHPPTSPLEPSAPSLDAYNGPKPQVRGGAPPTVSRSTTAAAAAEPISFEAISPETLKDGLISARDNYILLDVRPCLSYVGAHITHAMNVSCSAMLQRRLAKRKAKVEDQLCEKDRQLFVEIQATAYIIVYDDQSTSVPECETHTLFVFLSALMSHEKPPLFLSGGFEAFSHQYPLLVERGASSPPSLNFQLQPRPCVASLSLTMPMKVAVTGGVVGARQDVLTAVASQIQPFLFLGGKVDAENQDFFRQSGVRFVLNVTADCPNYFQACPEFVYKTIPIKDTWHQNISSYFGEAIAFIDAARAAGGSVLVHCMGGISRSATVVIAYLMTKNRWPLNYTYGFVKSLRATISPNLDFMGHLLNLEKELGLALDTDSSGDVVYSPAFPVTPVSPNAVFFRPFQRDVEQSTAHVC